MKVVSALFFVVISSASANLTRLSAFRGDPSKSFISSTDNTGTVDDEGSTQREFYYRFSNEFNAGHCVKSHTICFDKFSAGNNLAVYCDAVKDFISVMNAKAWISGKISYSLDGNQLKSVKASVESSQGGYVIGGTGTTGTSGAASWSTFDYTGAASASTGGGDALSAAIAYANAEGTAYAVAKSLSGGESETQATSYITLSAKGAAINTLKAYIYGDIGGFQYSEGYSVSDTFAEVYAEAWINSYKDAYSTYYADEDVEAHVVDHYDVIYAQGINYFEALITAAAETYLHYSLPLSVKSGVPEFTDTSGVGAYADVYCKGTLAE